MEKPKVYSERVRGYGRSYFFDLKISEKGDPYLTLTESRKDKEREGEYQTSRIMIFRDEVDAFYAALGRTIQQLHESRLTENEQSGTPS